VTVDGETRRFRATEAQGEERVQIWQDGLKVYPGWSQYERRASNRQIAVFVLKRSDDGYLICIPEMAREITSCWISAVPSKMS